MRRQIILAGVVFLFLGALFLIFYQIPETKEKSTLVLFTHEFQFQRYVQTTKVNVSLENSSEYLLRFSFPITLYENHSFQLMDPEGSDVPLFLESAKAELHVVTIRGGPIKFPLITLVERFESTAEGEYTFIVIGYHGKPFFRILLSKIESREQIQNTNLLFVGATFCAIGTTINVEGYTYKRGKYRCPACGYVYDPKNGDPSKGIRPGSSFDLPFTWVCPICGTSKEQFEKMKQS